MEEGGALQIPLNFFGNGLATAFYSPSGEACSHLPSPLSEEKGRFDEGRCESIEIG
jgi:hypothetical protein